MLLFTPRVVPYRHHNVKRLILLAILALIHYSERRGVAIYLQVLALIVVVVYGRGINRHSGVYVYLCIVYSLYGGASAATAAARSSPLSSRIIFAYLSIALFDLSN